MKILFAVLFCSFSYFCNAQQTIYVAPAPKTYWEQKREDADMALLYQMMLNEATEKRLAKTRAELEEYSRRSMSRLEQIKKVYVSYNKYPSSISNGWHKVVVTNNIDFCEERKVLVSNGKIGEYVVDNWSPRTVVFSSPIKDGKAIIKLSLGMVQIRNITMCILWSTLFRPLQVQPRQRNLAQSVFTVHLREWGL